MQQPHNQQVAETVHHQVTQSGYGRHERTSAQDRCVPMQTISGMTDRGTAGRKGDCTPMPCRANRRRPRIRAVRAA
jgi:hypothetical protein